MINESNSIKEILIDIKNDREKLLCPFCIKKNNVFHLFFAKTFKNLRGKNNTNIYLYRSKNFKDWEPYSNKPIIKTFSGYASHRVLSPSVHQIGRKYYLVFEGRDGNTSSIFFATSNNLIDWKINFHPIIIGNIKEHYFSPSILYNSKNKSILIYYCQKKDGKSYICLNEYTDRAFKKLVSNKIILKQTNKYESYSIYAPFVLRNKNKYIMLYSGWSLNPTKGRVMSAVSKNGFVWKKNNKPIIEPSIEYDIKHCSEPSIIDIKNKFILIYEGCNSTNNWRIMKKELPKSYDWNY